LALAWLQHHQEVEHVLLNEFQNFIPGLEKDLQSFGKNKDFNETAGQPTEGIENL